MKKRWKWILAVVVVIGIVGYFAKTANQALKTDLLKVEPQSIAKTFKEEGVVVPSTEQQIYTASGGKVINLLIKEGQSVKAGQLLLTFDTKELKYQLDRLQANLTSIEGQETQSSQGPLTSQINKQQLLITQAQQDLQTAANNLNKTKQLYAAGTISKDEYTSAQNAVTSATNNLNQQVQALSLLYESNTPKDGTSQYYEGLKDEINAQINSLNYQIKNSSVTAPADGVISNLNVKEGTVAAPSSPLMDIFQNDSYNIEVYILTQDAAKVEPGMKVNLIQTTDDNQDITFGGTVLSIAPNAVEKLSPLGISERRIKITIAPEIPASVTLRPGYALDVEFTTEKEDNRLVVPKTALFPYKDGNAIWVLKNGIAQIQPVKKGFENDTDVAILDGLKAGDIVVLNPQLTGIKAGVKIVGQ